MSAKPKIDESAAALRRRAETLLVKKYSKSNDTETGRMLHELEVHQIELEMQNAELTIARDTAEGLRDQYTELYDFAPVGYFTLNTGGMIQNANLTGATMVHTERSTLMGRSFEGLLAPRNRAAFRIFLETVFAVESKQSADFELADASRVKRVVNIEARRIPLVMECSIIIQDITVRKLAQEQMRISETHYRRLFEATHDGVLLIDPETSRIIDANPFLIQLLGYEREQLIGKELYEIGLLRDEVASRAMLRELKQSHEVRYENLPLKSKTGLHREVEVIANLYQEDGRSVIQCNIRDITVRKLAEDMSRRNIKLNQEITRQKVIEEDLLANRKEQSRVLRQARLQEKQLRELSHRIIGAQEEERKRISRELHDVIAQTLVGININLAVLTQGSAAAPAILKRQIGKTQLLVENAVDIVHDFARELRPTMLDDLGLIPALQAHIQRFTETTGIEVTFNAPAKIDLTSSAVRTVLYRVAQEALTNIGRHSKASLAEVTIELNAKVIRMEIKDNGKGFQVNDKSCSKKKNRLGLIGMKERVEMIGGTFRLTSALGGPTTVEVEIPAAE